jgi:hypothetical protein
MSYPRWSTSLVVNKQFWSDQSTVDQNETSKRNQLPHDPKTFDMLCLFCQSYELICVWKGWLYVSLWKLLFVFLYHWHIGGLWTTFFMYMYFTSLLLWVQSLEVPKIKIKIRKTFFSYFYFYFWNFKWLWRVKRLSFRNDVIWNILILNIKGKINKLAIIMYTIFF